MNRRNRFHWMALAFAGISLLCVNNAQALTVQEILTMSSQGLSEDVLVTVIRSSTELPELTEEDLATLKEANISDRVIEAIGQRKAELNPPSDSQENQENQETSQDSEQTKDSESEQEVVATDPNTTPALPVSSEVIGDNTILAPVETSNLPVIFRKFFKEAYETYIVQAEIARRYAELKDETDSERASDAELPKVEQWRVQIATAPISSLESCLALADEIKPGIHTSLGAALNQCIGLALDALNAPAMSAVYLDTALQSASTIQDYTGTFNVFLKNAHLTDYTSTAPELIFEHTADITEDSLQAFHYFIAYSLIYGPYPDTEKARSLLLSIQEGDVYFARSRILLATLAVRAPEFKFKTAAEYLQTAIKTLDNLKPQDNTSFELTNSAWLALARIAFENHAYDMASVFYQKVDTNSHHLKDALIENAWGELFSGHHAKALAITHALKSPWFKKTWLPDRQLIESSAWLGLCHYKRAETSLEELRQTALSDSSLLKAYMAQTPNRDFYNQVIQHAENPEGSALPERIYYRVISDSTFKILHHSVSRLSRERKQLSQYVGPAFTSWPKLQTVYDDAIRQRQLVISTYLAKIYENTLSELHALDISASQIAIEIRLARRHREAECLKIVAAGGECRTTHEVQEVTSIEKSDRDNYWTFDGEFWRDELHHYVSGVTSLCEKE